MNSKHTRPRTSSSKTRNLTVTTTATLFALFIIWYLFFSGPSVTDGNMGSTATPPGKTARYTYETVTGIFLQDDPATDWNTFEYMKHDFGLIDRLYPTDTVENETPWARFSRYLQRLASSAPDGVSYKLFYLGRHGEGFHNVAEAFYGTKAWDDYWSKLKGNGTIIWDDAHLTDVGKAQALANQAFMGSQLAWAKMPAPGSYYTSPLYRCLQTAKLTWSGVKLPAEAPFDPLIKELAREVLGEHTCDRRSSKSFIQEQFPGWRIEDGFSEDDELWRADHRETQEENDVRTTALLDDLFQSDEKLVLSVTSHSGTIASFLRVTGHIEFRLPTGGMIPVLVKATRQL